MNVVFLEMYIQIKGTERKFYRRRMPEVKKNMKNHENKGEVLIYGKQSAILKPKRVWCGENHLSPSNLNSRCQQTRAESPAGVCSPMHRAV